MKQPVKITFFYCANSLTNAIISECSHKLDEIEFHPVSLPCSGKVNLLYLLKSVENGSDGVVLATCKIGECKFIQGNLRASKRVEAVNNLLDETGLGEKRICFIELKDNQPETIINKIKAFSEELQSEPQMIKVKI